MDILNRINVNQHVKSEDINKVLIKCNSELENIVVNETNIKENEVDSVKSKYNKFIDDVTIILNKNTNQTFVYANIYPSTTYKKISTSDIEFSYSYEKINDILSITETMSEFKCYNAAIFTHDTSEYKILSEGDAEHFVDVSFPNPINSDQYYIIELNDNTQIPTKNTNIRIESILNSNYSIPRYTVTTNDKTRYVSQPFALLTKNMNNSKNLVFKTPNLETKDIFYIKVKDIYVGVLEQKFPLETQVSINKNIPINSKFSISETSDFDNIEILYNGELVEINQELTNTGKPLSFKFISDSSYVNKIVVKSL